MALDWTSLQLDSSGHIAIPPTFGGQGITTTLRTTKGAELTYLEGDTSIIDSQVRHFSLIPEAGTTDTLVQILGGHPGTDVMLRPADPSYEIVIEDGPNLHVPSGTIVLSEAYHIVMFSCIGADTYAKMLL